MLRHGKTRLFEGAELVSDHLSIFPLLTAIQRGSGFRVDLVFRLTVEFISGLLLHLSYLSLALPAPGYVTPRLTLVEHARGASTPMGRFE